MQWHDGKPFNAHDVVFSVDQFLRKTHARLRAGLAFVDSIKALDEHTVEFRLPRPFGPFLGCSRSAPCRWCRAISTKAPTT